MFDNYGVSVIAKEPNNIDWLYTISKCSLKSEAKLLKPLMMEKDNYTYLGFCDISDKEFKFKIQMFPIITQVQVIYQDRNTLNPSFHDSQILRYINKYYLSIDKIVFNSQ
ncbi:hypothetical protein [Spiroplasma endosymbiont of Virgichneumon dumeticola]|uniref:hypothetical protein n=1 Tax=Spiroplasma endosymbiont of Virgichneumon dumeticola TaxID=3139323 RepID=UPI0035C8BD1D